MNNTYEARLAKERVILLKYSENKETKQRFATFLIRFPKILLQELNTHRQLVRNCGSSRAIPTKTTVNRLRVDPYIPTFTVNQPGMVGKVADYQLATDAEVLWLDALDEAVKYAEFLQAAGIHKQDANRLLEPFQFVDLVLSGTDWENFFTLRCAPDAQLAFQAIAKRCQLLLELDVPDVLSPGEWHIPFDGFYNDTHTLEEKLKIAIARIARVSYGNHGKEGIDFESDLRLADSLLQSGHLSPLEHVAKCVQVHTITMSELSDRCSESLENLLMNYVHYDKNSGLLHWNRQYAGFFTYRHHIEDKVLVK
jgi:thymidylate synthase ThyX